MIRENCWEEGSKQQWVFFAKDNCSLEGLSEKVNIDDILCAVDDPAVNLGIHKVNGRLYSSNYVGVCRLKGLNGKTIRARDGREIIIRIEPRFPISVVEMLNMLRDDDEFESYLAPQTNRLNDNSLEVEDLRSNELFSFFTDDDPIFLKDSFAKESSIIAASVFITLLKGLCSKPLMGRMICKEENLVGKVKGKVVFSKNIRNNTLRGRDDRVFCRYLYYSEDILENQILKAALHKAEIFLNRYFGSISGNKNTYRDMLTFCRNALSHISYTKIGRLDVARVKTTGVYVYYKPVINAAKMVLNEITLEATGQSAVTSYVVPYAVSMDKLFEMYVRALLKRSGIKSYSATDDSIRLLKYDDKTAVLKDKGLPYASYIGGNIKPDIIVFNPTNEKYAVFDVKYKDYSSSRSARPDRLQILAYSLMYDCINVGNIFPTRDGTVNGYYLCNRINSRETTSRYYNQLEVAIDKGSTSIMIAPKTGGAEISIQSYFEQMLS